MNNIIMPLTHHIKILISQGDMRKAMGMIYTDERNVRDRRCKIGLIKFKQRSYQ